MVRLLKSPALWGAALIVAGGLLLLESLGVLAGAGLLWTVVFSAAGVMFLYAFFRDRESWWAAIPGFALLGLAAANTWSWLGLGPDEWGGALFLGGLGLGFVAVYLADHGHWWAVIPGGALLTLALVAGLSTAFAGSTSGGVLFLGLAATFAALAMLPTPEGRMRWALIPAAGLLLFGVLITLEANTILDFVWPVALVLGGLYLIFRAFRTGGGTGRHA